MQKQITFLILTFLIGSCSGSRLEATATPQIVRVRLIASHTTNPLAQVLIQNYVRSDDLFVISLQEGNWEYIESQLTDDVYGMTTYLPENSNLWAAPIGTDGIAIIAHKDVDVSVLVASQLRDIFTGVVNNWSQVEVNNMPLVVVSEPDGSDTRLAFERLVLGEREITPSARLAPTALSMIDIVSNTPGAIGYVSFGLVDQRVQVIPVAAVSGDTPISPSLTTIATEQYPLRTPILLVGKQAPDSESPTYEFFVWAQQGNGQRLIGQRYIPQEEP